MAVALETYQKDFGEHFARLTVFHIDGESWFKAKEAAIALGYHKPDGAIRKHVDADDKKTFDELRVPPEWRHPLGHNDAITTYISESGLYALILRSRLPCAKAFQRWVTSEVLPSIRRTGRFEAQVPPPPVWEERKTRLTAMSSACNLAAVLGEPLSEAHRSAAKEAINEVLLPPGRQQADMIDAAEFLRRKGHGEVEVGRLAPEFGKALKFSRSAIGRPEPTMNVHDFAAQTNAVRMYHAKDDAVFLEEVYAVFRQRGLFAKATANHAWECDRMAQSVREALRDARGFRHSERERSPRRG